MTDAPTGSAPARRARRRRWGLAAGVIAATVVLAGCSAQEVSRLGMPAPATDRARSTLHLWQGAWIAALIVGAIVWFLILFSAFRFHRRSEAAPRQVRYNMPIEIMYTFIPFVIIGVLFYYTVRAQDRILATSHPQHAANQVVVVGQQWSWTFNYDAKAVTGDIVYDEGNAKDLPTLWLPVNEAAGLTLHSTDVAHSFWVPQFLFKMDLLPGKDNYIEFTPTKLGQFAGKCAELCGAYHSRMLFVVNVVTPAQYRLHLTALHAQGKIGPAVGGSAVTRIAGSTQTGEGNQQ